jgi:hypothetical protein
MPDIISSKHMLKLATFSTSIVRIREKFTQPMKLKRFSCMMSNTFLCYLSLYIHHRGLTPEPFEAVRTPKMIRDGQPKHSSIGYCIATWHKPTKKSSKEPEKTMEADRSDPTFQNSIDM